MSEDDVDEVSCIQMISALVLQLVQSVAKIPPPVNTDLRQTGVSPNISFLYIKLYLYFNYLYTNLSELFSY